MTGYLGLGMSVKWEAFLQFACGMCDYIDPPVSFWRWFHYHTLNLFLGRKLTDLIGS